MLIVYTHKITPRLKFVFRQFFFRILEIPVSFTTKVEEFVAHNGPKISYAKTPLASEFFIRSHDLLFDQGITDIDISISKWDETPCFFPTGELSSVPFDVFAASFYLLSRYEEYLPHVQDEHERFPFEESLAFKNDFLEIPVIDIWALKFLEQLKKKFPNYNYKKREFKQISTVDIDSAYAYKSKGLIRTISGSLKDFFTFRYLNLWRRLLTIFNFRKDPYNTFRKYLEIRRDFNVKTLFFVLLGDFTTYDKNISSSNLKFQSLIKSIADYTKIGLHPSYFSYKNIEKLKKEKMRLENIINTPVIFSRQHFLRLSIPETYRNLIDIDILEDHTMGYAKRVGFRAGTCTPFYFYDIDYEIQTPLKLFPFAIMDGSLKIHMNMTNKESLAKILELKNQVKNVNGTFISLFHNDTLSETDIWVGWTEIYKKMIQ